MKKIISGLSLGLVMCLLITSSVFAAPLNWTADQNVTLGSNTLIVKTGSIATTFVVNTSNLVVTVPVSSVFTVTSSTGNLSYTGLSGSGTVQISCTSGTSQLVLTSSSGAIETITITASASPCIANTNTGGGGGGGSFVPAPAPTPTTPTPVSPTPTSIPTGISLINDQGTFYLIQNGVRQGITNPAMLYTYGYEFKDARVATSNDLTIPVGNNITPNEGSLVKTAADSTVYLISNTQRHGFTSASVFTKLGYKFTSVLTVTSPELNILPLGDTISTSTQRHVKGTKVSDHNTIYYLSDTQRLPYPSIQVYNSWNIDNDFSSVVTANAADLALPVGAVVQAR